MDRITLDVIGAGLLAIAEEMGEALIKSSYSTNIKERQDCSTALFNVQGEVIAQAEHIPMHLGSLIMIIHEILRRYPLDQLRDGDVFVGNDPYTGGSTHLPDITVASPVFAEGALDRLRGQHRAPRRWLGPRDAQRLGRGRCASRRSASSRRGVLREDVMELILLNFRLPRERRGDFRAQFAANRLGAARLEELVARYGRATRARGDGRAARLRRAQDPRGDPRRSPTASTRSRTDGRRRRRRGQPVPMRVAHHGDRRRIALDFTRHRPAGAGRRQRRLPGARRHRSTTSLKAVLDPDIPANGGFYRPIEVTAPEGSLVNAQPPAPVAWRTQTCQRIADLILGALAPALPERVIAGTNGANRRGCSADNPRPGSTTSTWRRSAAARARAATKDGLDGVQVHITNTSNLPVECLEMEYPLFVEEYALVPGSGGAGRFRGGLGIRRTVRVVGHEATFLGTLERQRVAAVRAGRRRRGGCGALIQNADGAEARDLGSKIAGLRLRSGDSVTIVTPGAGGYGRPAERDPDLLARDVRDGKVR